MIYLDNAATTFTDKSVVNEMAPWLMTYYGNPSSKHRYGREARQAIEKARSFVKGAINASDESQIIFTSGGSEGNTTVLTGVMNKCSNESKGGLIISNVEHESITRTAEYIGKNYGNCTLHVVNVDKNGKVKLDDLENILAENEIVLVSCIHSNNEIDAVNDIKEVADLCHKYGAMLHADCVQSLGNVPVDVQDMDCDFATFSSHKIHGPKGVGAIYAKDPTRMDWLVAGTQERGMRGGTENVAGIVGFGKACDNIVRDTTYGVLCFDMVLNREYFIDCLTREMAGIRQKFFVVNGCKGKNFKIATVCFQGIDAETLVLMVGNELCISSGSACHEHENEPSRVLLAVGLTEEEARSTVRFSFSKYTSTEDIEGAVKIIAKAIKTLQKATEAV